MSRTSKPRETERRLMVAKDWGVKVEMLMVLVAIVERVGGSGN
jgi:hypothetical protein